MIDNLTSDLRMCGQHSVLREHGVNFIDLLSRCLLLNPVLVWLLGSVVTLLPMIRESRVRLLALSWDFSSGELFHDMYGLGVSEFLCSILSSEEAPALQ